MIPLPFLPGLSFAAARLVVAVVILAIAWGIGWKMRGDQEKARALDLALAYAKAIRENQGRADDLQAMLEHGRADRAGKVRTITKEVVRYVEITPPALRCSLPGQWRVLHDAAATGTPPDPAHLDDGAAPAVADATALETVADNYADCREVAARLTGWQRWWSEVVAPANK